MQRFEYETLRHCLGIFLGVLSMVATTAVLDGEIGGAFLAALLGVPIVLGFLSVSKKLKDCE